MLRIAFKSNYPTQLNYVEGTKQVNSRDELLDAIDEREIDDSDGDISTERAN